VARPKLYLKKNRLIPIYNARLWIVVSDNIRHERKQMADIFGDYDADVDYVGLCSDSGGHRFAVFFQRDSINIELVSHEAFHLTHRILEWVGANFDNEHHEQGAMLHGYLMDVIWREVFRFSKMCS
jgi:hypothetical protein